MSDPALAAGDCRIEWADGGVAREHAATVAIIDDLVARYVAAREGTTK
jgi:flagellar assembly protein FliH